MTQPAITDTAVQAYITGTRNLATQITLAGHPTPDPREIIRAGLAEAATHIDHGRPTRTDEALEAAARVIAFEHGSTVFDDDHVPYEFTDVEREQYRAEARAVAELLTPHIAAQLGTRFADVEEARRDQRQAEVERDWLLAEATDELRDRFFAIRNAEKEANRG